MNSLSRVGIGEFSQSNHEMVDRGLLLEEERLVTSLNSPVPVKVKEETDRRGLSSAFVLIGLGRHTNNRGYSLYFFKTSSTSKEHALISE